MTSVPSPATVATGDFLSSALWNTNVRDGMNFLLSPVRFKGYASSSQSLSTGTTATPLLLDSELVDSDGGHSTSTNTSRYTCQTAGLYFVSGSVCFATNSAGTRTLTIFVNGAAVFGAGNQSMPSATNGASVFSSTVVQLAVGDYVELTAWQNSGSTLATSTTQAIATTMCLFRISN
jgi:hypothetical protein